MRTLAPLALVLALALTGAMFSGSGFNQLVDGEKELGQVQDQVDQAGAGSPAGEGELESNRRGTDDGSIVDLVISSAASIGRFAGLALTLPITMKELGFPGWFAFPVGSIIEILVAIGVIQFVSGRIYR
jgi:hypothetical protein